MSSETDLIERTYRAYFTVFQMGDPRAITPYFHLPSLFMSTSGVHALTNLRDAEQFFDRLIYGLRTRGYARSVLSEVKIKQLTEDIALVNARGERFKRDGELLERIAALYTMRKADGTWRIASATMYDPECAFEWA
jgi:hypothetical protein